MQTFGHHFIPTSSGDPRPSEDLLAGPSVQGSIAVRQARVRQFILIYLKSLLLRLCSGTIMTMFSQWRWSHSERLFFFYFFRRVCAVLLFSNLCYFACWHFCGERRRSYWPYVGNGHTVVCNCSSTLYSEAMRQTPVVLHQFEEKLHRKGNEK